MIIGAGSALWGVLGHRELAREDAGVRLPVSGESDLCAVRGDDHGPTWIRDGIVGTALVVGVLLVASGCQPGSSSASERTRGAPPRTTVTALGRLEPGEGVISITGPVGDRIERILVQPGQRVRAGEQIFETAGQAVLQRQVEIAQARLSQAMELLDAEKEHGDALIKEAEIALQRAKDIPALQIETQDAEVKIIENQLQQSERDLDRMKASNFSQSEQDRQTQLCDRQREQLRAARARLRMLQREKELSEKEANQRLASVQAGLKKAQQAVDVESAQRSVALAQAELQRSLVLSPIDGQVLEVNGQVGEAVSQRPVVTLGQVDGMFVSAEVYEADIGRIQLGQKAVITSAALGEQLTGTVDRIGQVVRRNEIAGLDPTARNDARVFEIRIRLDQNEPARQRIGLQVDVTVEAPTAEPSAVAAKP